MKIVHIELMPEAQEIFLYIEGDSGRIKTPLGVAKLSIKEPNQFTTKLIGLFLYVDQGGDNLGIDESIDGGMWKRAYDSYQKVLYKKTKQSPQW